MPVRLSHLVVVGGIVALLVLSLAVYAGILSSDWISLLACTPALVCLVGIVGGMLCGMFFFEAEEDETPEEAARPDAALLLERGEAHVVEALHRTAIELHVRGLSR
jgi:hypothetical protein